MDEHQERAKLLDFGLTQDVVDIIIAKKKELERQKSCVIIADPIPIPEQIQEQILDIIPDPEPLVDDGRSPSSGAEIKKSEEHIVKIKQETLFYAGMPIWKRRLSQRNNK